MPVGHHPAWWVFSGSRALKRLNKGITLRTIRAVCAGRKGDNFTQTDAKQPIAAIGFLLLCARPRSAEPFVVRRIEIAQLGKSK
jgi:hypothetical protein